MAFPASSFATDTMLQQALRLYETGQLDKAEEIYRNILRAEPDHPAALNDLGRVLQNQGRLEEAGAVFRRLTELRPDLPLAHMNLGVVLCQRGLLEESFASFRRHAELAFGKAACAAAIGAPVPDYKIRHDREQCDYLKLKMRPEDCRPGCMPFHIEDGSRVSGLAVNPDTSGAIAAAWQSATPQLVVIDNFLSNTALEKLRRFCWGSTIWRRIYENGYLGAFPEHGLGSPLLAQIVEDMRAAFPAILKDHPLLQFWAFKYDSRMKGINLHADFAAVNVNFWITPDEANLDPESGGLIVWDKPAPLDWDFTTYNRDEAAGRAFLAEAGARPIRVPHRANRALIFDSDLFHETDRIAFREGYTNRRINITFLFGRREKNL